MKSATNGNAQSARTRQELDEIDTMWTRISSIVKKRQSDLALAETQTEKFWSKQSQIHSQLDQLDDELRSLKETHEGYDHLVDFESKQNQVILKNEIFRRMRQKLFHISAKMIGFGSNIMFS